MMKPGIVAFLQSHTQEAQAGRSRVCEKSEQPSKTPS
jgi:hypothetical protein